MLFPGSKVPFWLTQNKFRWFLKVKRKKKKGGVLSPHFVTFLLTFQIFTFPFQFSFFFQFFLASLFPVGQQKSILTLKVNILYTVLAFNIDMLFFELLLWYWFKKSNILERIVYNHAYDFLRKNDVLYRKQYGFRTNHSTNMTVLDFVDEISKAIDNDMYTIGIFMDLSKTCIL